MGDFNATPFSWLYSRFVEWTEMENAMSGQGYFTTWDMGSWLPAFAIDHVFFKGGLKVNQFSVGPDIGSDHMPVQVQLSLE